MFFLEYIWIIPLLPLLGAAVMFFFGRGNRPRQVRGSAHGHEEYVEPSPDVTHYDPHAVHGPADAHTHVSSHGEHAEEPYANPEAPHTFVNAICVGLVVIAFVWSVIAVWQYTGWAHGTGQPFEKIVYTWLGTDHDGLRYATPTGSAPFKADFGFLVDPLSAIWLLFVTGVGMLIHIYSTGYMAHEGGYYRFF